MAQEHSVASDRRAWGIEAFAEVKARMAASEALAVAIAQCDPQDAVQIMSAALEDMSARCPEFSQRFFDTIRSDAAFWADIATPAELEAYVSAGLLAIERRAFCAVARKRIFAALWGSFSADDRKAFMARVDPNGKFMGRTV